MIFDKNTWLGALLLGGLTSYSPLYAAGAGYGAVGAENTIDAELSLESMLNYAIEDEYLARAEYQKIIATFGSQQPFTNILKAEEKHVTWLEPLFAKYQVNIPEDRGLEQAVVPNDSNETLSIGVAAEIANIDMYTRFLAQELPMDVRDVFERLRKASKNHLTAFQKRLN